MESFLTLLRSVWNSIANDANVLVMALALLFVGALAMIAFLRLATFSREDIIALIFGVVFSREIEDSDKAHARLFSRIADAFISFIARVVSVITLPPSWVFAGIRSIGLYFWFNVLTVIPEAFQVWRTELLPNIYNLPPIGQMGVLFLPLALLGVLGFLAIAFLPVFDWLGALSNSPTDTFNSPTGASGGFGFQRSDPNFPDLDVDLTEEVRDILSNEEGIVTWSSRRKLGLASFCAFILGILAKVLGAPDALVVFFFMTTWLGEPVKPSLALEMTHPHLRRWIFSAVWVYFWATACLGWILYGWWGIPVVTVPTFMIAGGGLFIAAGVLLPVHKLDRHRGGRAPRAMGDIPTFRDERKDFVALFRYPQNKAVRKTWLDRQRKRLRCLVTYALGTNYPYHVVVDEKIKAHTEEERTWLTGEERVIERVTGDTFSDFLSGPGLVLTGCDHAVILHPGTTIKGAKGPGLVFTGFADRPVQAVDLRVQLRAFPVEAWTKDGIRVRVVTFIPFQIDTGRGKPVLGKGFPYRASAVFRAAQEQVTEHTGVSQVPEDTKRRDWYDWPQLVGERIMQNVVAHYRFTRIYKPYGEPPENGDARSQIVHELAQELDRTLPIYGLQRIGCGISNILPMDEERVIGQQIQTWRSNWERRIMKQQAQGQKSRLQAVVKARADAQVHIISEIGRRLGRLEKVGAQDIAMKLIVVLQRLAQSAALRPFLPMDTSQIINRVRGGLSGRSSEEEGA